MDAKTIQLSRGEHRHIVVYAVGDEGKALDALVEMVNDPRIAFDWFDAAVLSHQLGQHLANELKAYLPKPVK